MCRYYVIDRYRQVITLDYVNEHIDSFKSFNTYEEAYDYHKRMFFDDSSHGVFYRTEDDKFLCISYCLQ